jgi:hypothetical protein
VKDKDGNSEEFSDMRTAVEAIATTEGKYEYLKNRVYVALKDKSVKPWGYTWYWKHEFAGDDEFFKVADFLIPTNAKCRDGWKVSKEGKVRSPKNVEVGHKSTSGYTTINIPLIDHEKPKQVQVRRLVAFTFHPEADTTLLVRDKDGNKQNNRLDNLELVDIATSVQASYAADVPHAKKKAIDKYDLDGNFIDSFTSIANASRSVNPEYSKKRGIRHHIDKGTKEWMGFIWKDSV